MTMTERKVIKAKVGLLELTKQPCSMTHLPESGPRFRAHRALLGVIL
jgi:hypothetical protein